MKAAVYEGIRDLRVQTLPDPEPSEDDLVMRIAACGVCGSDLHSYTTGAFVKSGQVMGHEFSGEVLEVGRAVQDIVPGMRVTAMPFNACYKCDACLRGDVHLCYNLAGQAIAYGLPGAYAEYLRVPRATLGRNVFELPEGLSDAVGATIEPLAVAVHAVSLADPPVSAKVVVLGAGLIGQCVTQVLRARGAGPIVVADLAPNRAALAADSGADVVADPSHEHFIEQVGEAVGHSPRGRGATADVVFDCAGVPASFKTAQRLVRPGGTIAITALYEESVQFNPSRLVWGEVKLVGTFGYRNEFPQTIALLASGKVDVSQLITDTFPLDDITAGFERQLSKDQAMKVMIQP